MMDKNEIIERLGKIAKHAVHTIGEEPFIMSLDDGIAAHEAIEIIQQSQQEPDLTWKLQEILDYLDNELHPIVSQGHWYLYSDLHDMISVLMEAM